MATSPFDDLSDVYEAMIDWPKRLAHEEPFYRRLVDEGNVRRALDVACGAGRHAAMLHGWGLEVEGADLSPAMIQRAEAGFGRPRGLRWVVRGFDAPLDAPREFDLALCVGNSLALAPDEAVVAAAIGRMFDAVGRRGTILVHALNLWRLDDGPCLWQKCQRATLPQGEVQIVKGVHRCGSAGWVELLLIDPREGALLRRDSVPFLGLEADALEQFARQAGARQVQCFGGYQGQPYVREQSADLVIVANRQATP